MEYLHVFVGVSIESLISAKKIHFSRVCILSHFANIQLFSTCYSQSTHVLKGQLSHDYHSFVFFLFHLNFSLLLNAHSRALSIYLYAFQSLNC